MKFLLPLILLPVFALAQSATVPKATLLTLSDSINQEFLTPQALFREEKSLISATFLVKPGEKPDLVANLYLDGGDLGAPLAKDIPLQINAKSTNPALLEGNFNFTFPPVKKPTLFRILVTEKGQTGKSAACASFAVRLYPKDWFAITVRKITEHSAPEIVIFGKLPGLEKFLQKNGFNVRSTTTLYSCDSNSTVIGQLAADAPLPTLDPGASLLVFQFDPNAPAGMFRERRNGTLSCVVNAPPPRDWQTNPTAQILLLQTILHTPSNP